MNKTFTFDDSKYTYETGEYNDARLNERAVEVPIAAKLATTYDRVLEVGNVLSHYGYEVNTVVDMGDYGKGFDVEDILLFKTGELFDCAICISALVHFPADIFAIEIVQHIKSLLKPGSPYLFTIPYGYNASIHSAIDENEFSVDNTYRLDKVDFEKHTWKELTAKQTNRLPDLAYNGKSQWANTLYILAGNTPDEDELSSADDFKNISDPQE